MTSANEQLADMLEANVDLYFYVTGNINDYSAYNTKTSIIEKRDDYLELFEDIKKYDGIDYADYETYLYADNINTCVNLDDSDSYSCLFLPSIPDNYYSYSDECRPGVTCKSEIRFEGMPSGNTVDQKNKRYDYLKSFEINANVNQLYNACNGGIYPSLIGVNQTEFPDLANNIIKIIDGDNFENDDISNGTYKAIVPTFAYFADADGVKSELKIGDTFSITFKNDGMERSFMFEIIGLHDGIAGYGQESINISSAFNIYIPAKTLENLAKDYESWLIEEGLEEDEYTNGQLMGIKPFLIRVRDRDIMSDLLNEITPKISTLSVKDEGVPYSYVSSLDKYADALTMSESNSFVFKILNVILTILTLISLALVNVFNINASKKEIGILNSLGESKWKINLRFLGEFVILNLIPLIMAICFSTVFTKIYAENEFSYEIMKILSGEYNVNFYDDTASGTLILKFMINFRWTDYVYLLLLYFAIAVLASFLSYLKIRRLDPKTILLTGER